MSTISPHRVLTVDSHTGGEPTRVVIEGGPDLGPGPLPERLIRFRDSHDRFRSAVVNEPRGSDVVVGALLLEPWDSTCDAAVIFFNNVGYLGMCGHGTIGLVATLAHLGWIGEGRHRFETPVGIVSTELRPHGIVSVENVPSYRRAKDVVLEVPEIGEVKGDVAWGGNWFFLTDANHLDISLGNVAELTEYACRVRQSLNDSGYPEVDHVELYGPTLTQGARSRNFVLCPGRVYDRSPCGTGTSAKLACLAEDGKLPEGDEWVQESIVGSTFAARYRWRDDVIVPTIAGQAFVSAESTLLISEHDRFGWGIRP